MTNVVTNHPPTLSPFRFDTSPRGEADVDPDQIAVLDEKSPGNSGWGDDGFGFKDVLDILNPLQHIPIISSIYRAVTGDEIAAAPRAIGGAIFGGPVGLVAAIGNEIMEAETGRDFGETTIAMFNESKQAPDTGRIHPEKNLPAPQLAIATPEQPVPNPSLIERLGKKTPPRIPGSFIPSDAAARAGLFSANGRAIAAPAAADHAQRLGESGSRGLLQSAPASALDRLIANSQAATSSGPPSTGPQIPTDSANVHQWMLRALGKYETMPKS
jgi:hypothetical protein